MVAPVGKPTELDNVQARAVASLSEKLHLPFDEVREVYLKELDRLKSQARITGFVDVLAVSSARSVLSCGKKLRSRS